MTTSELAALARARLSRIHAAVPPEGPTEHVRNALAHRQRVPGGRGADYLTRPDSGALGVRLGAAGDWTMIRPPKKHAELVLRSVGA